MPKVPTNGIELAYDSFGDEGDDPLLAEHARWALARLEGTG